MASVPNMRLGPPARPGSGEQPGEGTEAQGFAQLLSGMPADEPDAPAEGIRIGAATLPVFVPEADAEPPEASADEADAILNLIALQPSDPLTVTVPPPPPSADGTVIARGAQAAASGTAPAAPAADAPILSGPVASPPAGDRLIETRQPVDAAPRAGAQLLRGAPVPNDVETPADPETAEDAPLPGRSIAAPDAARIVAKGVPASVAGSKASSSDAAEAPPVKGGAVRSPEARPTEPGALGRQSAAEIAPNGIARPVPIDSPRIARPIAGPAPASASESAAQPAAASAPTASAAPIAPPPFAVQPLVPAAAAPGLAVARRADVSELLVERQLALAADGEWLDQLARDIARTGGTDGRMHFRLNPEHLGTLRVELAQGEQGTSVRLIADSEAARAMLADAQPRLIAEARAQGVRLAETHVDLAGGQAGDPRRQDSERREGAVRTARDQSSGSDADGQERPRASSDRYA